MSASLLEKVAGGDWQIEEPRHTGGWGRCVAAGHLIIARIVSGRSKHEKEQQRVHAQLIALAYDHALLLSALQSGQAKYVNTSSLTRLLVVGEVRVEADLEDKDAFSCMKLTPELRAALRAALGLAR